MVEHVIRLIDRRVREPFTVIRSARQTGKNECDAEVNGWFLTRYKKLGGSIVRCAPTFRPQTVLSKRRVARGLAQNVLIAGSSRFSEGFIFETGHAQVYLLSADKEANVLGATASHLLDIDEAHKIDPEKFREELVPMTASTAAPIVLWGVAAHKTDVLYETKRNLQERGKTDCILEYPASVWCDLNPAYAEHYETVRSMFGAESWMLKTQYDLVDVEAVGGFFTDWQVDAILSGEHQRGQAGTLPVYVVIDIGGEDRFDRPDEEVRVAKPGQDSTAGIAFVADWIKARERFDLPDVRIIDLFWRTGARLEELQGDLFAWLQTFKARGGVCDARGIGNQIASTLRTRTHGWIRPYMATAQDVSDDCYDAQARANLQTIHMFRDDGSPEWGEFARQLQWATAQIHSGDKLKITKPMTPGGAVRAECHIDFAKALTYLRHAAKKPLTMTGIMG